MKYTAEKKKRTKSGVAWYELVTLRYEAWCVLKDGKFFCEARSEAAAKQICMALNFEMRMMSND